MSEVEVLRRKKGYAARELKKFLRAEFNGKSINVSHGLGHINGTLGIKFNLHDTSCPDEAPSQEIVKAAHSKLEEILPGTKFSLSAGNSPRKQ